MRGDPPVATEDFDVGEIPIEYTLGLLEQGALADSPSKIGDFIPAALNGDEVLREADTLVSDLRWRDPVFARLAIIALISQQTATALSWLVFRGTDPESPGRDLRRNWPALLVSVLFGFFYSVVFAACIGYGLVYALRGDGFHASICVFFASGAVAGMIQLNRQVREDLAEIKRPERIAYDAWRLLNSERWTIGSAHGLDAKLHRMMAQEIAVPNVLIDLCAVLCRADEATNIKALAVGAWPPATHT